MNIEYINPLQLKTYENNAKIHTAFQIEQIKKSIQEFGFLDPIGVWKENIIAEGNGRIIAAVELGIDSIPIIRLEHLSKQEFQAYVLVHNQLTLSTGLDADILAIEIEGIGNIDMKEYGFADIDTTEYFDDEYEPIKKSTFLVAMEKNTKEEELKELLDKNRFKYRVR